jgi:hypothetical protein
MQGGDTGAAASPAAQPPGARVIFWRSRRGRSSRVIVWARWAGSMDGGMGFAFVVAWLLPGRVGFYYNRLQFLCQGNARRIR